jgi:FAD/FMN-containing dehydrogenase
MARVHPWYVLMDVTNQGPPGSLLGPLGRGARSPRRRRASSEMRLIAASGTQAAKLWKMRESLPEAVISAGGAIPHDISVPCRASRSSSSAPIAPVAAAYPGIRHCAFGHVGDGNMHYNPCAL